MLIVKPTFNDDYDLVLNVDFNEDFYEDPDSDFDFDSDLDKYFI